MNSFIALGIRGLAALSLVLSTLSFQASGLPRGDVVGPAKPGTGRICLDCDPTNDPPLPPPPPPPPPRPSFATLMSHYTPFDINADGTAEINSLKALFPNPEPYYSTPNGVVIVLVDPRLVTDDPAIQMSRFEMSLWLAHLGNDIASDGFFPYFVEASVYDGPAHQDGRTLLAMRRFLQEVRSHYPLAGVLLVGSFPDASIVRSVFVKENAYADNPISLTSGAQPVTGYSGHFLGLGAEFITPRAEVVLGDMDGNWENLYRPTLSVTSYKALPLGPTEQYPQNGQYIYTPHYQATDNTYQDVFYIQDHSVIANALPNRWLILNITSLEEPSPEVSAADRLRPNRIARPEIVVSRLDPRRVAVMPTAPTDLDGKTSPLDANGRPQELRYNYPARVIWRRDGNLERKLVADYIARSHRFRLGYDSGLPFRTSAIRALNSGLRSPASFNNLLRQTSDGFQASTEVDNAMLIDYVNWLKEPAVLRGISAHSDGVNSQFGLTPLSYYLALATGGYDATGTHVWRWVSERRGPDWVLTPSFEGLTVDANFHIYRTMWETGVLQSSGQSFFVHEGCEVMRPKNAERVPYNDPTYGQADYYGAVANGESLMFYANGLGLLARNKVFNDVPDGFYKEVKSSGRFGFGWRSYFFAEADKAGLNERTADPIAVNPGSDRRWRSLQRKRSYFWSTVGDPTLKLRY